MGMLLAPGFGARAHRTAAGAAALPISADMAPSLAQSRAPAVAAQAASYLTGSGSPPKLLPTMSWRPHDTRYGNETAVRLAFT